MSMNNAAVVYFLRNDLEVAYPHHGMLIGEDVGGIKIKSGMHNQEFIKLHIKWQ